MPSRLPPTVPHLPAVGSQQPPCLLHSELFSLQKNGLSILQPVSAAGQVQGRDVGRARRRQRPGGRRLTAGQACQFFVSYPWPAMVGRSWVLLPPGAVCPSAHVPGARNSGDVGKAAAATGLAPCHRRALALIGGCHCMVGAWSASGPPGRVWQIFASMLDAGGWLAASLPGAFISCLLHPRLCLEGTSLALNVPGASPAGANLAKTPRLLHGLGRSRRSWTLKQPGLAPALHSHVGPRQRVPRCPYRAAGRLRRVRGALRAGWGGVRSTAWGTREGGRRSGVVRKCDSAPPIDPCSCSPLRGLSLERRMHHPCTSPGLVASPNGPSTRLHPRVAATTRVCRV